MVVKNSSSQLKFTSFILQYFLISGETATPNPQDKLKFTESNENAESKLVKFFNSYLDFVFL